jgi:hypothetical protein
MAAAMLDADMIGGRQPRRLGIALARRLAKATITSGGRFVVVRCGLDAGESIAEQRVSQLWESEHFFQFASPFADFPLMVPDAESRNCRIAQCGQVHSL